jgi:hypothetical protein
MRVSHIFYDIVLFTIKYRIYVLKETTQVLKQASKTAWTLWVIFIHSAQYIVWVFYPPSESTVPLSKSEVSVHCQ